MTALRDFLVDTLEDDTDLTEKADRIQTLVQGIYQDELKKLTAAINDYTRAREDLHEIVTMVGVAALTAKRAQLAKIWEMGRTAGELGVDADYNPYAETEEDR